MQYNYDSCAHQEPYNCMIDVSLPPAFAEDRGDRSVSCAPNAVNNSFPDTCQALQLARKCGGSYFIVSLYF